ncbi:MAG: hypothetical protein JO029_07025 [Candidatus Eremiobacteraeota bacterium]|nr:hypothetical protein [Candidatus Eremiobacteraeota bacterium]
MILATLIFAASGTFGDLGYRSIGPAISGGRTTAVAGSNRDPLLYYAGGAGGGVFKSIDGGASWNPVFDRERVASIGAIALSPRDDRDLWVGTGESNPRNDVESGAGIWHSTDGGKSWAFLGLGDAGQISSISIDPRNPRTVVAGVLGQVFRDGTTRGAYVTHDGGAHWTRALYAGPSSGVSDMVRVPDKPATLFAGVWQFRRQPWMLTSGGGSGGLFRSDDGGSTWRKVTGGGFPTGTTGRIGLAAATGGRLYAIVQSKLGELWRSDDGGTSWKKMPRSEFVGARPFYFSRIFVDPSDRDRLVSVGLALSMSSNGGRTFSAVSTNGGWDYHTAWWSADGRRVIVGSDEGIVLNGNAQLDAWQPYDVPFSQPYHVGLGSSQPSYRVCIGLQDNNSWCSWSAVPNGIGVLNRDWSIVGPGDGMWALVDPLDEHLIWTTSTNSDTGQLYLFDERTQQAADVSPYVRSNAEAPKVLQYRFNWDSPIAFTTGAQPQVLAGGNVVFASSDRGQHWTLISPDLTRNERTHQEASGGPIDLDVSGAETSDTILDIEVSPLAPGTFWVGTDDGLVQLTRDGGTSWHDVTPKVAPWGRFSTVETGHYAPGTAYAAYDRHMLGDQRPYLFLTDDYGATWRSIAANLPVDSSVRTIREDRRNPKVLYAGTERGVWVSLDRGASWRSMRLNMPATAIYDLQIQPAMNDLVVASHGRGVWILDDLRAVEELAETGGAPKLFAIRDAYRTFQSAPVNAFSAGGTAEATTSIFSGATLPLNEFVGGNPPYGALLTYWLDRPAPKAPSIDVVDSGGRVVRHLRGDDVRNIAGINRVAWDLSEDGPVQWRGTFKSNRGPAEGAEALPGSYTVRLQVAGRTVEQPLVVRADPRDSALPSQYVARHDFLVQTYAEIGGVDTMLNAIDDRLKHASGAASRALRAFQRKLTYNPRNVEDLSAPQGLRERLLDIVARLSSSYQAPTAAMQAEGADLKSLYDALSAEYAKL